MVSIRLFGFCLLFISIISGCQKNLTEPVSVNGNNNLSTNSPSENLRLSYGDSLFFLKNQPGNFVVTPVTKPKQTGYFKAIPMGLSLDTVSGNINISKSETGLRYKIYYIATNGKVLDSVKIVVSGIDFSDAIYEIASTPNTYDTAFPIYNARREIPLPCGDDDEDDDGDLDDDDNQCVFDETDLDGDGNDDIAGVIQDKFLIDIKKGTFDAEASLRAGVFGSSNPDNGITKDFSFYYRLQDASNRALNKLTVRLYHFKKRSDIPQSLLDILTLRKNITTAVNNKRNPGSGGDSVNQALYLSYREEFSLKPKRPPIIIVVSE